MLQLAAIALLLASASASSPFDSLCPAVDAWDPVYIPDPDCTKFWECSNGVAYQFDCPSGLHFNTDLNVCDWPDKAGCDGPSPTEGPAPASTENPAPAPTSGPAPTSAPADECTIRSNRCPAVDGDDSVYFGLPDCTKFCQCSNGVAYKHDCPDGLHFNTELNVCDWPQDAGCNGGRTSPAPAPTKKPTAAPTAKPTAAPTSAPSDECTRRSNKCPAVDGPDSVYFGLPDCTKFCQCSNGVAYKHDCPDGLHFNTELNVCDWPQDAGCDGGRTSPAPPPTKKPTAAPTAKPTAAPTSAPSDECTRRSNQCPAVDGPDSVYFGLPDCTKFCQCSNGVAYKHDCPDGLHFNTELNVCDWPQDAGCDGGITSPAPPPTKKPTAAPTAKPTAAPTSAPSDECTRRSNKCPAVDGPDSVYFGLPDCTKFCQCSNGVAYKHDCPDGLHFNTELNVCDWPQDAGCDGGRTSPAPPPTKKPTAAPTQKPTAAPTSAPSDECTRRSNKCPAVDGPDSVYFGLPDCTKFCQCSNGVAYKHDCPDGLHFNTELNVCDWPQDAGCDGGRTSPAPAPTKKPTAAPTAKPTAAPTSAPSDECTRRSNKCPAVDGPDSVYFGLPDCTKFCQCSNGVAYKHDCPDGLHFNTELNVCDWPQDAGCDGGRTSPAPPPTKKPTAAPTAKPTAAPTSAPSDECTRRSNQCPAVDGPDSVYFGLPDCTKFCQCSNGVAYKHDCPDGLHFNTELNVCDWPQDAGCDGGRTSPAPPPTKKPTAAPTAKPTAAPTSAPSDECTRRSNKCPAVDGPDSVYFGLPDCTKFCQCSNGVAYKHDCPDGLHFNTELNVCDWPQDAGCDGGRTSPAPPPTKKPTAAPTQKPTAAPTSAPSDECTRRSNKCPAVDGPDSVYFGLPDCTKFCQCSNGVAYKHDCPDGLHFNTELNVCDWPQDAGCDGGRTSPAPPPTKKPTAAPTQKPTAAPTSAPSDECTRRSNKCPAVDGPDSVYFGLPDCTKFCQCSNGVAYKHDCPDGLHFNTELNVCDWPQDAGCDGGRTSPAPPPTKKPTAAPTAKPTAAPTSAPADECTNRSNQCPAVDGPDSVYFGLPDCTKFCQCSNGVAYKHDCPDGLHFNTELNVCDWAQDAGCA